MDTRTCVPNGHRTVLLRVGLRRHLLIRSIPSAARREQPIIRLLPRGQRSPICASTLSLFAKLVSKTRAPNGCVVSAPASAADRIARRWQSRRHKNLNDKRQRVHVVCKQNHLLLLVSTSELRRLTVPGFRLHLAECLFFGTSDDAHNRLTESRARSVSPSPASPHPPFCDAYIAAAYPIQVPVKIQPTLRHWGLSARFRKKWRNFASKASSHSKK